MMGGQHRQQAEQARACAFVGWAVSVSVVRERGIEVLRSDDDDVVKATTEVGVAICV